MLLASLRRPALAATALRLALASAPRGWWRKAPYLPLADPEYLGWRMDTAYGTAGGTLTAREAGEFLAWTRRLRRIR